MTCDQIREYIPGLVRRELSGFERIPVLNHLQQCQDCQTEYKQYLKIFYSIDLEIVSPPIFTVPVDVLVSSNQAQRIKASVPHIFRNRTFYIAAAILILGLSLIGYIFKAPILNQKSLPDSFESVQIDISRTSSITQNIDSRINAMLAENKIPLAFIEKQLLFLQKKGIENFKLQQSGLPADLSASGLINPIYDTSVPVDNCLEKVQSIKKYKSYLTISELVSFLNILQKQGV